MGLSGVSGPFKGAYLQLTASTESLGVGLGHSAQVNLWSWTIPTGMDIEIVNAQAWCASASTNTRINILAGGASILATGVNTEQLSGVGLVNAETTSAGGGTTATVSTNIFGLTATSITNSATPSSPGNVVNRGYPYGAYIVGGATLSVTVSNTASPYVVPSGAIRVTIVGFVREHPSSLRHGTE
jgi:hypothetical protein